MELLLLGVIIGFPFLVHLALTAYAYLDAPNYGMDANKWALVSFVIPFFGFFAYLFERDERTPDPDRDEMFVDGPFEIHKSRADDTPLVSEEPDADEFESDGTDDESRT